MFIRYCENQDEVLYIVNNVDYINTIFSKNGSRIIFICNDDIEVPDFFYKVSKNVDDTVNRNPLISNTNLQEYLRNNVILTKTKKVKV